MIAPDKPISNSTTREAFRRDLKGIGPDPSKCGPHSLFSGGATLAVYSGISDRVFQRHGRWKSVQAKDIYVDDDLDRRLYVSNSLGFKSCKVLVSISPLPNTLSLYIGVVLARPSQNKLIWFSVAVLLFVVEWRQNMLFLTSELANKAEITILSARDITRAWIPGRSIMGRNVGVYKTGYNTWLSSRLQNQPRSFRFVLFNFLFSLFSSFFFRYHASSLVGSAVLISFL